METIYKDIRRISVIVSYSRRPDERESAVRDRARLITRGNDFYLILCSIADLGSPFFPGGPELWHHPLAWNSTAGELPGTLQHATLVHPALHPQVPVRSYLWLSADKALEPPTSAPMHVSDIWSLYSITSSHGNKKILARTQGRRGPFDHTTPWVLDLLCKFLEVVDYV